MTANFFFSVDRQWILELVTICLTEQCAYFVYVIFYLFFFSFGVSDVPTLSVPNTNQQCRPSSYLIIRQCYFIYSIQLISAISIIEKKRNGVMCLCSIDNSYIVYNMKLYLYYVFITILELWQMCKKWNRCFLPVSQMQTHARKGTYIRSCIHECIYWKILYIKSNESHARTIANTECGILLL